MMSVIAAKNDYVYKANMAYANLQENEEIFNIEAKIINYMKCALLRNDEIEDFYIDGVYVSVYQTINGYELCFLDYSLYLDIYDKQIINLDLSKN